MKAAAKRSHGSGYGEHLQRRAGVFRRARRAWAKASQPSPQGGRAAVAAARLAPGGYTTSLAFQAREVALGVTLWLRPGAARLDFA
ncbi:MAG TPA: hypothetical protein P5305_21020, partial [Rubrivivax sp.]|nr:hypothetical protein [Rubrivivax sp.]